MAIGAKVTRFEVGDEVFGIAQGSFAEYAAAREDKLTHKPESLAFEQAAVMGVSGLTALRALDIAGVAAGWRVRVVGGRAESMPSRSPSALGVDQIGGATDLGAVVATPSAEVDAWTLAVSSESR